MKALVLAPLASSGLDEFRAALPVVYERWIETRSMYALRDPCEKCSEMGVRPEDTPLQKGRQ